MFGASLQKTTVFLPVGGKATRAKSITGDRYPKHLIRLDNGQTVLATICSQLQLLGFCDFVFCVGHHMDQIIEHVATELSVNHPGASYRFSKEVEPLGPDGAVVQAIQNLGITGNALIIPGDAMLSWHELTAMCAAHVLAGASITVGVCEENPTAESSGGIFVVEPATNRLLAYYQNHQAYEATPGAAYLRSAAATVVSVNEFVLLCRSFAQERPHVGLLNFRHEVLPWALQKGSTGIQAHRFSRAALDLGTPANILVGQRNWQQFVT